MFVVGLAAAADTTPTATSSKLVSFSGDPSTVGVFDGDEAAGPDSTGSTGTVGAVSISAGVVVAFLAGRRQEGIIKMMDYDRKRPVDAQRFNLIE